MGDRGGGGVPDDVKLSELLVSLEECLLGEQLSQDTAGKSTHSHSPRSMCLTVGVLNKGVLNKGVLNKGVLNKEVLNNGGA